jgi:hypothetical protein
MLGVGFCNKRYPENEMPGWYQYSWAYHGDDGAIFLNANPDVPWYKKDTPSDDFGANGEYAANDTIGVGLNLETGKGFVTLNGEKRDVGKYHSCLYDLDTAEKLTLRRRCIRR